MVLEIVILVPAVTLKHQNANEDHLIDWVYLHVS